MARKIQVKLILLLRSTGMSQRAICQSHYMSRSLAGEVFRIAEEKQLTYADVEILSNEEVYNMFFLDKFPHESTYATVLYLSIFNCSIYSYGVFSRFILPHEHRLRKMGGIWGLRANGAVGALFTIYQENGLLKSNFK